MGCDRHELCCNALALTFQSTQPEWAATAAQTPHSHHQCLQPTQPGWAGPSAFPPWGGNVVKISIHAARMGCDSCGICTYQSCYTISIHAARMGCDQQVRQHSVQLPISIHAARMGCDLLCNNTAQSPVTISIHAARMGCDRTVLDLKSRQYKFQSTQPEWAATWQPLHTVLRNGDFNPRSPNGLRPGEASANAVKKQFQSTQPEWAATSAARVYGNSRLFISIHAARMGCDRVSAKVSSPCENFNPRSPNGLRLKSVAPA